MKQNVELFYDSFLKEIYSLSFNIRAFTKTTRLNNFLLLMKQYAHPKMNNNVCSRVQYHLGSNIVFFSTSVAHPSSDMPSRNSFLLNSHCVAALNFHATTSMLMLAGSRVRSSQNCWIPSMPILLSSCGSANTAGSQQNSAEV